MAALLGLVGVASVGASMLPGSGPDAAWLRDFLMTVGSSIALFVLFYLVTRSLDRHLDQVAADTAQQFEEVRSEAAETTTALTGQVEALREDVDRRLGDVVERVTARLEAEVSADRAAFASLRTMAPTRETVWDALARAHRLGLVSSLRPPRVSISRNSRLYASFELDTNELSNERLQLRIESLNGVVQDWIPWLEEQDAEEVLVEVGRSLLKHTGEEFDPGGLLVGLADLLETARSHPERRPAIELCPPQWMVCDWGVIACGKHYYGVNLKQLQTSPTISGHVAQKTWVDADSWDAAYEAALALFPAGSADPWGSPGGADEPPF